jgi:hypothetical protein
MKERVYLEYLGVDGRIRKWKGVDCVHLVRIGSSGGSF